MIEIKEQLLENMSFIDLFAGIGGFRLALESLGGHCVYSNEWDKYAQSVYFNNFGDVPEGDITQVDERNILIMIYFVLDFHVKLFRLVENNVVLKIVGEHFFLMWQEL